MTSPICVLGTGWKIAQPDDPQDNVASLEVTLSILGDKEQGYNLVMSPEGLFTADCHYPTRAAAIASAAELFAADPARWAPVRR